MQTLSELTNGWFSSLSELTEEKIQQFMRAHVGNPDMVIPLNNMAPMFDHAGAPVMVTDPVTGEERQLCLSYTHACVFAYEIMRRAGRENAQNTMDVHDLPVPFWRSTDVYVMTNDGHTVLAQRSNFNNNAAGKLIFTAAGFASVESGKAHTSLETAQQELFEETGLSAGQGYDVEFLCFGRDTNNPISAYPIKTKIGDQDGPVLPGRVPIFAEKYAVKVDLSATEVLSRIQSNGESLGFAALPLDALDAIESDQNVDVVFAPATKTLELIRYPDAAGRMQTLSSDIRDSVQLSDLRHKLAGASRPQDGAKSIQEGDAAVDILRGGLGAPVTAVLTQEDVSYSANPPWAYMRMAAEALGILPQRPPRDMPGFVPPVPNR